MEYKKAIKGKIRWKSMDGLGGYLVNEEAQ